MLRLLTNVHPAVSLFGQKPFLRPDLMREQAPRTAVVKDRAATAERRRMRP
jgi:hypothetical protein